MSALLRPLDAGWLWLESPTNLMHGAVLCVFDPPEGAAPGFVADLVARMRSQTSAVAPHNQRLKASALGRLWPQWETVDRIDPDRHVVHLALPSPGGERELAVLISQLQSTALDKTQPLWSLHVIEGLPEGRFAIFGKMHHAMADGVAALAMVDAWLSDDPDTRNLPPLWAAKPNRRTKPAEPRPAAGLAAQLAAAPKLFNATARAAYKAMTGVSARPWSAPHSPINTPITARRRVATQAFELDRFRNLAKRTETTINDVVLAVCSGALRRYLDEIDGLPDRPLITNIPVSLRQSDAKAQGGNAISWAMVSLATDIEDPRERLAVISAATTHAKQELGLMGATIDTYTLLAVTPILAEQIAGLGGHIPPMYNVPISNVPGPRQPKYLDGALLREIYALTVLYGGQALNMVVVSYTDRLNFSFTACADALPHVQRLASHCRDALSELEGTTP